MKQSNEQVSNETIRLGDIVHVLLKHYVLIIALAICGLVIGITMSVFSYMRGEMSRTYAITSAIAVTSQTQDGLYTNKERTPNSTDITLAENMADSVIYVLKSERTLNAAIKRMNLVGISIGDIKNNLNVTKYGSTQIIELTLYWRNAEEGVEILNAINTVAPTVLSEVLQIGNVSVVNTPKSQYRIGGSVNAKLWVIMVMVGAMIGMGISVLELFLRPKVIRPEDVSELFKLHLFGEIPENKKYFASGHVALEPTDENTAFMDEHFLSIARILKYHMQNEENKCICVTSAGADEGKSSIVARIAYQLSEQEQKVLLLDLDLRNPSLAPMFGEQTDYYHSLNGLYRGDCTKAEAIKHITGRLDLLSCMVEEGRAIEITSELKYLLKDIVKDYDYVFIDMPPVGYSSDIMAMRSLTENVVFLIKCDRSTISEIDKSLQQLKKSGISAIGCIVNGVKKLHRKNTYSYYKRNRDKAQKIEVLAEKEEAESSSPDAENRVIRSSGLDKKGMIDESVVRSYEEYREGKD